MCKNQSSFEAPGLALWSVTGTGLGLEAWTKTKQKELEIKSGDTNGQN